MRKSPRIAALLLVLMAPFARAAPGLNEAEGRWIAAGMPVVRFARAHDLPVDIVVQPSDQPEVSPIAIGIDDGRCKLVLSMRGNPGATALVAAIPAELFDAVAEAVFAHELGHCWRYVRGQWNAVPAGFVDTGDEAAEPAANGIEPPVRELRETRREEGFADLVGLAWTRRTHPERYAAVRAWLERFRFDAATGEHHDTGAWLRLAVDASAFDGVDGIFRQAFVVWEQGLRAKDRP